MGERTTVEFGPESMRVMKSIARSLGELTKTDVIVNLPGTPPEPAKEIIDTRAEPTQKGTDEPTLIFDSNTVHKATRLVMEKTTLNIGEVQHIFRELTDAGFAIMEVHHG